MARARRSSEASISLFPFLSILACVIGVLTLVIMSLSLSQIAQGRENEDVARSEEYAALEKRITRMRQELAALGRIKAAVLQKLEMQTALASLEKTLGAPADAAVADELREKLAGLDELLAEQTATKQELDAKRKEMEDKLARFEELKKKPKVLIQPSGGDSRIRPLFVETRKDGLVIHAISKSIPVKLAEITTDENYKKLVDYVREGERSGRTIVFLIRQDGLGAFQRAREFALGNDANIAKLPLIGEGPVDLAAFGVKR